MFGHFLLRPTAPTLRTNVLLGLGQLLLWGGSYFLLAVLAQPIARDTGWALSWVYGSLSLGLLIAGLLSPWVGRHLARPGGTALMGYSGAVIGLGLLLVAAAPSLPLFGLGWGILGVGMALGLYDALFATLGKHYGAQAKGAIVQITLVSGCCTTVVWPLLAASVAHWGWRGTCAGYGLLLGLVIWPLHRVALPAGTPLAAVPAAVPTHAPRAAPSTVAFRLLAAYFTVGAIISTALSVQLVDMLRAQGLTLATAIGLGALIGPSTVGVRVLDLLGPPKSTLWTALFAVLLVVAGLALLGWYPDAAAGGIVCYGLGNGLRTILRGTLPLELFSADTYPLVLGRLALPVLVAQALTPLAGGFLAEHYGVLVVLRGLAVLGVANVGITLALRSRLAARATRPSALATS